MIIPYNASTSSIIENIKENFNKEKVSQNPDMNPKDFKKFEVTNTIPTPYLREVKKKQRLLHL
jgi:hypothetical protein